MKTYISITYTEFDGSESNPGKTELLEFKDKSSAIRFIKNIKGVYKNLEDEFYNIEDEL